MTNTNLFTLMRSITLWALSLALLLPACSYAKNKKDSKLSQAPLSPVHEEEPSKEEIKSLTAEDIAISRHLLYDKHTLEDRYAYKDTFRTIDWQGIAQHIALVENMQQQEVLWAVLQNYKNKNGEAPLVKNWHRDEYDLASDDYGVARYQSIPLYALGDTLLPERYGRDGSPVYLLDTTDNFWRIRHVAIEGEWLAPRKYIKTLGSSDSVTFDRVAVIDRDQQNIVALQRVERGRWQAISINPCTTGKHRPPYGHETPLGTYVVQDKKEKMYYLHDGKNTVAGYAPFASRFTNGAYLHGVPTQHPKAAYQEWSWSLGTTPRSHMCVRLASSHAAFLYKELRPYRSLVIVMSRAGV